MSRIVDQMADLDWSERDIINRTEAMIASQFPHIQILQRKVQGQMLGQYTLTTEEQAELQAYAMASFAAGQAADEARADMALLREVWAYEGAVKKLDETPDHVDAQAVVDSTSDNAKAVAANRATLSIGTV